MSIIVSNQYEGRELAIFANNDKAQMQWQKYPVCFTKKAKDVMRIEVGIAILEGTCKTPNALAGIKTNQIVSSVLRTLNEEYQEAIATYKHALVTATESDAAIIAHNHATHSIREDFFWTGWFWSFFGVSFMDRATFNHQAQTHRYLWFDRVSQSEQTRLIGVSNRIINAFPKLIEQLEEMVERKQVTSKLYLEAWQLQKVYHAVFSAPNERMNYFDAQLKKLLPDESTLKTLFIEYTKDPA